MPEKLLPLKFYPENTIFLLFFTSDFSDIFNLSTVRLGLVAPLRWPLCLFSKTVISKLLS